MNPDLVQARAFLARLESEATRFCFQLYPDRRDATGIRPRWRYGTFDTYRPWLTRANAHGSAVTVMLNHGERRTRSAITAVRGLFLDTDGAPRPDLAGLEHLVVESSPGRLQIIILCTGVPLSAWSTAQKVLAERFGTDSSVTGLVQVVRLPGFLHHKREPFLSRLLEVKDHPPLTWPALLDAFPFLHAPIAERGQPRARPNLEHGYPQAGTHLASGRSRQYALTALRNEASRLACAGEGTRNSALCKTAYALGGYVGAGYLDRQEVVVALQRAGKACGLPEDEVADVLGRALNAGIEAPRRIALRKSAEPADRRGTFRKRFERWAA